MIEYGPADADCITYKEKRLSAAIILTAERRFYEAAAFFTFKTSARPLAFQFSIKPLDRIEHPSPMELFANEIYDHGK